MPTITRVEAQVEKQGVTASGYVIEPTFHLQVHFSDGRMLSIIQGPHSYGGPEGYYECGYFLSEDSMGTHPQWGDMVRGWQNEDEVEEQVRWICTNE